MEGGDRGGLAERKKFAERKKILEKSRKTLDRERPSHGRTLAINCGLPAIRLECELGLGCMYSSPSARFSALHTFQAFGNSEKPPRNNALRGALAVE